VTKPIGEAQAKESMRIGLLPDKWIQFTPTSQYWHPWYTKEKTVDPIAMAVDEVGAWGVHPDNLSEFTTYAEAVAQEWLEQVIQEFPYYTESGLHIHICLTQTQERDSIVDDRFKTYWKAYVKEYPGCYEKRVERADVLAAIVRQVVAFDDILQKELGGK
jgi:hypothetical protein